MKTTEPARPVIPGTAGYRERAADFIAAGESVTFDDVHAAILSFLPSVPGTALDIGACSGRDAAALAARGHRVTAVEPVAEFRAAARRLHPEPGIEWLDDALPGLHALAGREGGFDLILLQAVWMHLDADERRAAMARIAALARPDGRIVLSLRHGPVPPGRRMFAVTASETTDLAQSCGLARLAAAGPLASALPGKPDVTWTRLVFERG